MRKIKVVVLLVQQLQHGFTKNAKVSPKLTVAHVLRTEEECVGKRVMVTEMPWKRRRGSPKCKWLERLVGERTVRG